MKYNYYVYLPRIGTILVMFLTCSALFSKEIFFNIIYLVFVVLFSQILFIYEKRLLKNNEPQYEKISFRDSLLMYPILLKIELFLFAIVSLFSILILLCINKTIMALITFGVITIIISLYFNMRRHYYTSLKIKTVLILSSYSPFYFLNNYKHFLSILL